MTAGWWIRAFALALALPFGIAFGAGAAGATGTGTGTLDDDAGSDAVDADDAATIAWCDKDIEDIDPEPEEDAELAEASTGTMRPREELDAMALDWVTRTNDQIDWINMCHSPSFPDDVEPTMQLWWGSIKISNVCMWFANFRRVNIEYEYITPDIW